jgi:polyisoprenoid-binding protein YceI
MEIKQTFTSFAVVWLLGSTAWAADTYKIDPVHTRVGFSVRHLGISNVKGVFDQFEGSVVMDGDKIKEASATIQVKSVNTRVQKRDSDLRSAEFFDAEKYPTITYKTKRVEGSGAQTILIGDFTMHGVTKELRLPTAVSPPAKDPWGNTRIGLEAKAKLNRKDYGIHYNQLLGTGISAVGDEVELEINAEAVKQPAGKSAAGSK